MATTKAPTPTTPRRQGRMRTSPTTILKTAFIRNCHLQSRTEQNEFL
jgi:hypothetical protein